MAHRPKRLISDLKLSDALGDISLHGDWAFGHGNAVRRPQKPDHSSSFLDEAVENRGSSSTGLQRTWMLSGGCSTH